MSVTAITPYGEIIDEFVVNQENRPDHLLGFITKESGPGELTDITISASGELTSPDETGYYGLELPPGYHEASFMLEGYCTVDSTAEVFEGTETTIDTEMMIFTNISKYNDLGLMTISPNPVASTAILNLNFPTSKTIEIGIYNTTGNCLKTWKIKDQTKGKMDFKLDLNKLPTGIYFCRLQMGNDIVTKKIIKL
jgi:hypothetical protein